MSAACRVSDLHFNPSDCCGCPGCCHSVIGPAVTGSSNVMTNSLPSLRSGGVDMGTHCCCCGPNIWFTMQGSPDVFINGAGWTRIGDTNICCGGVGSMITGSGNVFVN